MTNKRVHCCFVYYYSQQQNGQILTWLTVSQVHSQLRLLSERTKLNKKETGNGPF